MELQPNEGACSARNTSQVLIVNLGLHPIIPRYKSATHSPQQQTNKKTPGPAKTIGLYLWLKKQARAALTKRSMSIPSEQEKQMATAP
jgi:hypothetical protein